jgi:hypothetical protein
VTHAYLNTVTEDEIKQLLEKTLPGLLKTSLAPVFEKLTDYVDTSLAALATDIENKGKSAEGEDDDLAQTVATLKTELEARDIAAHKSTVSTAILEAATKLGSNSPAVFSTWAASNLGEVVSTDGKLSVGGKPLVEALTVLYNSDEAALFRPSGSPGVGSAPSSPAKGEATVDPYQELLKSYL